VKLCEAQFTALDHAQGLADAAQAGARQLYAAFCVAVEGVEGQADVPCEGLAAAPDGVEPERTEGSAERLSGHALVLRNGLPSLVHEATAGITLPA
jgi:hypothetical protein